MLSPTLGRAGLESSGVESCLVEAAASVRDTGERIVSDGWRMLLPPAGGSKAAAFFPFGKNKPRRAFAEAGTGAPLRAAPARHCDGAARSVSIG